MALNLNCKKIFKPSSFIFLWDEANLESQTSMGHSKEAKQTIKSEADGLFKGIKKMEKALKPELSAKDKIVLSYRDEHAKKAAKIEFKLSKTKEKMLKTAVEGYKSNKNRYETVAQATGIPAELVATIHYQESNMNFNTYLHNGQELGKKTTLVPEGIFFDEGEWEKAAIHALGGAKESAENANNGVAPNPKFSHLRELLDLSQMADQMTFAEMYNGPGYHQESKKSGKVFRSPYVYAGTNYETTGRFVADNKFDPEAKSSRIGAAVLLKGMKDANALEA